MLLELVSHGISKSFTDGREIKTHQISISIIMILHDLIVVRDIS